MIERWSKPSSVIVLQLVVAAEMKDSYFNPKGSGRLKGVFFLFNCSRHYID